MKMKLFQVIVVAFLVIGLAGVIDAGSSVKIEEISILYQAFTKKPDKKIFRKPTKKIVEIFKADKDSSITFRVDVMVGGKVESAVYFVNIKETAGKLRLVCRTLLVDNRNFGYLPFPSYRRATSIDFGYGKTRYANIKIVGKTVKVTFFKIRGVPSKRRVPPRRPGKQLRARKMLT